MTGRLQHIAGFVLIITAALGLVLSLTGLILLWTAGPRLRAQVLATVDLASRAAENTDQGLVVLADSLSNIQVSIVTMKSTSDDIATALDQTVPVIDSTSVLAGDTMAGVIRNTQNSLSAAQASAKLVDDTLALITTLPLIGKRYAPSESLSASITDISKALNGLPEALAILKINLKTTSDNVSIVRDNVSTLSGDLDKMASNVQDAQQVVGNYQDILKQLRNSLDKLAQILPGWISAAQAGLTIFFAWLGLSQVGLALQGISMLRNPRVIIARQD